VRQVLLCLFAAAIIFAPVPKAHAQVTVYHDRTTFLAALSTAPTVDNLESYPLGDVPNGDVRGDFRYTFNPAVTQPAIVSDGGGGQALGGSPFDVFVGGDNVALSYTGSGVLRAFGVDFAYAPSFDAIPADTYQLGIADGAAAGSFAGNPDSIDPNGGTFFLGVIADFGFPFSTINLYSVQQDPTFLVPAYQADNLTYAAVPEPIGAAAGSFGVLVFGALLLVSRSRTRAQL
jgi:hypothetical protein